jgi:hypothetical protein
VLTDYHPESAPRRNLPIHPSARKCLELRQRLGFLSGILERGATHPNPDEAAAALTIALAELRRLAAETGR